MLSSSVIDVVLQFGDLTHPDENHTMADAVNGRDLHIQWDITTAHFPLTCANRRSEVLPERSRAESGSSSPAAASNSSGGVNPPHAASSRAARSPCSPQCALTLAALVAEFPDATLEQFRELLRRRCRLEVSLNTVWRALRLIDFPLKKRHGAPARRARRSGRRSARSK
jgi:hypothetical protein